jgi:mRNA interferase MazF
MQPGEIYLAHFPFGDVAGMKLRPVLLLTNPVGPIPEVLVAYISSIIPSPLLASDMLLDPNKPEFLATHLKTRSTLRLHKLATIHCASLARLLGVIDASARREVSSKLVHLLGLSA